MTKAELQEIALDVACQTDGEAPVQEHEDQAQAADVAGEARLESNRGDERSKNTKLYSPLRLIGTMTLIRKESQSGQPDNYLTFELVKLQVNKYLPILTFTNATSYYGCSQNFSQ